MNTTRDPEATLLAWLDEGPTELPGGSRRAILTSLPTTPQARRGPFAPRRLFEMNGFARLATVTAVAVVAIGGTLLLLGRGLGPGPVRPSPTPVATPSAASATLSLDTFTWKPFTSPRHGFSASYPSTFQVFASVVSWSMPDSLPAMFDGFNDPGGTLKWLTAASMKLAPGTTQDEWLAAYRRDLVEDQRPLEPARCFGPREDWTAIEIDGRPAELRTGCGVLEATLFVGDRVYVFGAYATDGATPATAPLGVPEAFRQLFDAWLTTITLDPGAAVDPPETTPRPSGG